MTSSRLQKISVKNHNQGVTKRCRLSWLTKIRPRMRGVFGVSVNEFSSCAHGVQINFGDLTPYLTYGQSIFEGRTKMFTLLCGPRE